MPSCIARGKLVVPERTSARAFYELTQEMTEAAGLPAYEISNHAVPGEESRHNLLYWRYGEYAGVGPGAHGRVVDRRRAPRDGRRSAARGVGGAVEAGGHGIVETARGSARPRRPTKCC